MTPSRYLISSVTGGIAAALLFAIPPGIASAEEEVNLYSARKEELIKPLLDRFTEQTGIKVNMVTDKAETLLKRLESEGINSPADLLITVDAGNLYRAKEAGVTQPIDSQVLIEAIPEAYRDPEGHWFGLSLRARPILYVEGKVDPTSLTTYEALADPEWKGRICIRSSDNVYNQSLVAAMIAADGVESTETWATGLVANMARPPKGGDRDQIAAAAAGQCDIAIANTYYLAGMLTSGDPTQMSAAEAVRVFWPNQDGRGAHVNVSGIAMTGAAKNKDAAIKLAEFLVSADSQAWYAEVNGEYPVVPGAPVSALLESWGEFKADDIQLSKLGELGPDAVRLMDRAGWK
ncbi:Fe(3+) ABC transporter substrate-binding protein [Thiocapsa bogorovii]|uniref:Fe(3+) ABC transporter substrate-binding protein n=1 Tax=Thiocapsa bogorovii TaxID=521689 RepID=UPI001E585F2D|nr:Fe(3+) ABC transporter substrate-binding protein [Thiocapsa bogorovii]UHD15922.1 Fe(3+) ABC transporter substrate-binding protein [Thiocapsa bogorovii]